MAKYYYCPLYLPASMRQPGTIINQASYQPGLTVGGETTSATAALLAAGVDLSVYSTLHGSRPAVKQLQVQHPSLGSTSPNKRANGNSGERAGRVARSRLHQYALLRWDRCREL